MLAKVVFTEKPTTLTKHSIIQNQWIKMHTLSRAAIIYYIIIYIVGNSGQCSHLGSIVDIGSILYQNVGNRNIPSFTSND